MGFYRGPHVVTDGLVLWLDAANPRSYPGSGTVWNDMSGNNNTGTLTNGPTFSSASLGSIVFDGTNDVVTFTSYPALDSTQTKNIWIRCTNLIPGNNRYLIDGGLNRNWVQLYANSGQPGVRAGFTSILNNYLDSITRINANQWYNICITSNASNGNISIYINGILDNSVSGKTSTTSTGLTISNYGGGGNLYYIGDISQVQIYNRTLSAQEVKQNYDALKGRYNLI